MNAIKICLIQTYVTEKMEYVMPNTQDVNEAILAMIVGKVGIFNKFKVHWMFNKTFIKT